MTEQTENEDGRTRWPLTLDPNQPAPDLDPDGHFGVEGETWDDDEPVTTLNADDYVTMAEEPIEDRLRRAFLNGYAEGAQRASWGKWDR